MYRGEVYKIKRNPRYKREGLKTEETPKAEITYPDGSVKSGVKEVTAAVTDILKIDCGQFTQIAMIAQGEFLKLLQARTNAERYSEKYLIPIYTGVFKLVRKC